MSQPARQLRLVKSPEPIVTPSPPRPRPRKLVLGALLLVQVCFGLNYLFSKIVLASMPPLLWASLRALGTAAILVVVAKAMGKLNFRRALLLHRSFTTLAALGIVINQACFLTGLSYTTPTNSALINTLIPIFTVLLVILRKQERPTRQRLLGCLSAFLGVLALQDFSHLSWSNKTLIGDLLTLFNAVSYSLFLSYSQRFFERHDFIWSTTWLFVFGAIGLTFIAAPQYLEFSFRTVSPQTWLFVLGGIIIGAAVPYTLISFTLGRTESSVVALFVYIQAIIAAALSYAWLGESFTRLKLFASGLIFLGLFLALSRKVPLLSKKTPLTGV